MDKDQAALLSPHLKVQKEARLEAMGNSVAKRLAKVEAEELRQQQNQQHNVIMELQIDNEELNGPEDGNHSPTSTHLPSSPGGNKVLLLPTRSELDDAKRLRVEDQLAGKEHLRQRMVDCQQTIYNDHETDYLARIISQTKERVNTEVDTPRVFVAVDHPWHFATYCTLLKLLGCNVEGTRDLCKAGALISPVVRSADHVKYDFVFVEKTDPSFPIDMSLKDFCHQIRTRDSHHVRSTNYTARNNICAIINADEDIFTAVLDGADVALRKPFYANLTSIRKLVLPSYVSSLLRLRVHRAVSNHERIFNLLEQAPPEIPFEKEMRLRAELGGGLDGITEMFDKERSLEDLRDEIIHLGEVAVLKNKEMEKTKMKHQLAEARWHEKDQTFQESIASLTVQLQAKSQDQEKLVHLVNKLKAAKMDAAKATLASSAKRGGTLSDLKEAARQGGMSKATVMAEMAERAKMAAARKEEEEEDNIMLEQVQRLNEAPAAPPNVVVKQAVPLVENGAQCEIIAQSQVDDAQSQMRSAVALLSKRGIDPQAQAAVEVGDSLQGIPKRTSKLTPQAQKALEEQRMYVDQSALILMLEGKIDTLETQAAAAEDAKSQQVMKLLLAEKERDKVGVQIKALEAKMEAKELELEVAQFRKENEEHDLGKAADRDSAHRKREADLEATITELEFRLEEVRRDHEEAVSRLDRAEGATAERTEKNMKEVAALKTINTRYGYQRLIALEAVHRLTRRVIDMESGEYTLQTTIKSLEAALEDAKTAPPAVPTCESGTMTDDAEEKDGKKKKKGGKIKSDAEIIEDLEQRLQQLEELYKATRAQLKPTQKEVLDLQKALKSAEVSAEKSQAESEKARADKEMWQDYGQNADRVLTAKKEEIAALEAEISRLQIAAETQGRKDRKDHRNARAAADSARVQTRTCGMLTEAWEPDPNRNVCSLCLNDEKERLARKERALDEQAGQGTKEKSPSNAPSHRTSIASMSPTMLLQKSQRRRELVTDQDLAIDNSVLESTLSVNTDPAAVESEALDSEPSASRQESPTPSLAVEADSLRPVGSVSLNTPNAAAINAAAAALARAKAGLAPTVERTKVEEKVIYKDRIIHGGYDESILEARDARIRELEESNLKMSKRLTQLKADQGDLNRLVGVFKESQSENTKRKMNIEEKNQQMTKDITDLQKLVDRYQALNQTEAAVGLQEQRKNLLVQLEGWFESSGSRPDAEDDGSLEWAYSAFDFALTSARRILSTFMSNSSVQKDNSTQSIETSFSEAHSAHKTFDDMETQTRVLTRECGTHTFSISTCDTEVQADCFLEDQGTQTLEPMRDSSNATPIMPATTTGRDSALDPDLMNGSRPITADSDPSTIRQMEGSMRPNNSQRGSRLHSRGSRISRLPTPGALPHPRPAYSPLTGASSGTPLRSGGYDPLFETITTGTQTDADADAFSPVAPPTGLAALQSESQVQTDIMTVASRSTSPIPHQGVDVSTAVSLDSSRPTSGQASVILPSVHTTATTTAVHGNLIEKPMMSNKSSNTEEKKTSSAKVQVAALTTTQSSQVVLKSAVKSIQVHEADLMGIATSKAAGPAKLQGAATHLHQTLHQLFAKVKMVLQLDLPVHKMHTISASTTKVLGDILHADRSYAQNIVDQVTALKRRQGHQHTLIQQRRSTMLSALESDVEMDQSVESIGGHHLSASQTAGSMQDRRQSHFPPGLLTANNDAMSGPATGVRSSSTSPGHPKNGAGTSPGVRAAQVQVQAQSKKNPAAATAWKGAALHMDTAGPDPDTVASLFPFRSAGKRTLSPQNALSDLHARLGLTKSSTPQPMSQPGPKQQPVTRTTSPGLFGAPSRALQQQAPEQFGATLPSMGRGQGSLMMGGTGAARRGLGFQTPGAKGSQGRLPPALQRR